MLYTLVSFIVHFSVSEQVPKINNTLTFKTLYLCEKALEDQLIFIKKKNSKEIFSEFITNQNDNSRLLKIFYTDTKLTRFSKCVKSRIAFNKEKLKENTN